MKLVEVENSVGKSIVVFREDKKKTNLHEKKILDYFVFVRRLLSYLIVILFFVYFFIFCV